MKVPAHFTTRLAGNYYRDIPNLIVCSGEPLLRVERSDKTGELLVELAIFDSNGKQQARVKGTRITGRGSDDYSVSMTEHTFAVHECSSGRMVCELQRRAATRDMDVDLFLLTHGPDGFFLHVSPVQTNLRMKSTGQTYEDLDSALVLN